MNSYIFGVREWAVFRNGKMFTDSLISEEHCLEHIEEAKKKFDGDFTYKLISEEERKRWIE